MSYEPVKKAMAAGTPPELICAACPWDRLCVKPPSMTSAEIDRAMKEAEAKDRATNPDKMPVGSLMTALVFAGRDSSGELCPVFSLRLRDDRRVADAIRSTMRSYGQAKDEASPS